MVKRFVVITHSFWSDEIDEERRTDRSTAYEAAVAETPSVKKTDKKLTRWAERRTKACKLKGCSHSVLIVNQITAVMEKKGMVDSIFKLE